MFPKNLNDLQKEIQRCIDSPYYFATTYLKVNGLPFTTPLTEEEFNKKFHELEVTTKRRRRRTG